MILFKATNFGHFKSVLVLFHKILLHIRLNIFGKIESGIKSIRGSVCVPGSILQNYYKLTSAEPLRCVCVFSAQISLQILPSVNPQLGCSC